MNMFSQRVSRNSSHPGVLNALEWQAHFVEPRDRQSILVEPNDDGVTIFKQKSRSPIYLYARTGIRFGDESCYYFQYSLRSSCISVLRSFLPAILTAENKFRYALRGRYQRAFAEGEKLVCEVRIDGSAELSNHVVVCALNCEPATIHIDRVTISRIPLLLTAQSYHEAYGLIPSAPLRRLDARLEVIDGRKLRGWAVVKGSPSEIAEIEIQVDDTLLTRMMADGQRNDLLRKGLSTGRGGFEFSVPTAPLVAEYTKVSVVDPVTGISITEPRVLSHTSISGVERKASLAYASARAARRGISIIIPVYNACDYLRRCVSAIIRNSTISSRLIIVDDCSSDPDVTSFLETLVGRSDTVVLQNSSNLGFTKTVNRGIDAAGDDDVVLLNSDTEVGVRWLAQLQLCAYSDASIASCTALSDNAGAFSIPDAGENDISDLTTDEISRIVSHSSSFSYPDVPTGNGFCMFIKREALNACGRFDEEAFPRGYGEENDWCRRAARRGWRHVVADGTFVRHARSASFGAEKTALYAAGRAVIDERYPEYKDLVRQLEHRSDFKCIRSRIRHELIRRRASQRRVGPRILFVISKETGGTPQTNLDLMGELRNHYEPYLLRCEREELSLSVLTSDGELKRLKNTRLSRPIDLITLRSDEYDGIVREWLVQYSVELIHVRHLAWHGLGLLDTAATIGIPIVFSFHDFFAVCPTVKLLDGEGSFCAGNCANGSASCKPDLWSLSESPPLRGRWVLAFRELMQSALARCSAFVTTSPFAKELVCSNLPTLRDKNFQVIPHGRTFTRFLRLKEAASTLRIKILVPGNINVAKGSRLIQQMAEGPYRDRFEFHILGASDSSLRGAQVINHGKYAREEFQALVSEIMPHIGAIFSIWPETYCHTLTEMWSCGLPVVGFDIGAVGERIREHGGGWALPTGDAETTGNALAAICSDHAEIESRRQAVLRWQDGYAVNYKTSDMAERYRSLYNEVMKLACPTSVVRFDC